MRTGSVFYKDLFAGTIWEAAEGFCFQYDAAYLASRAAQPVSLTLPLQSAPFESESKVLFPFFDGLIPEGWLLSIAVHSWKINIRDRFELLLTLCNDCIGAVSVKSQKAL